MTNLNIASSWQGGVEESGFSQIATYGASTSLGLRLLPGLGALSAGLSQTTTGSDESLNAATPSIAPLPELVELAPPTSATLVAAARQQRV